MAATQLKLTIPESKVQEFINYASEQQIQIVTSTSKEAFLLNPATTTLYCVVDAEKQANIAAGPWKEYLNK